MAHTTPYRIKSITELHKLGGYHKPQHPLISWIDITGLKNNTDIDSIVFDFYVISLKRGCDKLIYGQQKYDFDEGLMAFFSPGQVLRGENGKVPENLEGWMLFIHPDFIWNTTLATKIKRYHFFDYAINEALFLSDKEETLINEIVKNIKQEYHSNIDKFSQNIIISHIETILNYAQRFYERQFITRKITNHHILDQLESLLANYFNSDDLITRGLPSVQYVSDELNISKSYLRSLLKSLTGQSTQQLIHDKLIKKAKEKLSTNNHSISEIAYDLGFEHSQSFSKFFKTKTKQTPLEFRQSFN